MSVDGIREKLVIRPAKGFIANNPAAIARRYDKLAPYMGYLEWLLCIPKGFRERALSRLHVPRGGRILIAGCGKGPDIGAARDLVGPRGTVVGIDLSPELIACAKALCLKNGWDNVSLHVKDAAEFVPDAPFNGVIFALSYLVMSPRHKAIARHLWQHVVPGGRMGVMECKLPSWLEFLRPLFQLYVNVTYLGDISIDPEKDFEAFGAVDKYSEVFRSFRMSTVRKA